jgi:hypothetical protein
MSYNMLSFIPHSGTAWSDYFPGTNPTTTLVPKEYTSTETPSVANVYVLNCLFNKCSSSSNGGALSCSSVTYLLVESSSFFSCKTNGGNGGAIYFSNTNSGECVLHNICGNDCSSSSNGQFEYIYVKDVASGKNYVNYSSIVRCVNENSGTYYTLRIYYGKICCPSVNISMNKCYYRSAISCVPFTDSNSITCTYSYSSFVSNSASVYNCLHFNNPSAKYEMKSCNIIRNSQVSSSEGIIRLHGSLNIDDSCILENTATYIFNHGSSSVFTLSNCTVDKTTSSADQATNTERLIIKNTITKSFILGLNHMSTELCSAEYDSAGTLTPVIPNPSCNQIIHYYTCKIFFNQPRLRDIISLICVFVYNFIQPYPSV